MNLDNYDFQTNNVFLEQKSEFKNFKGRKTKIIKTRSLISHWDSIFSSNC